MSSPVRLHIDAKCDFEISPIWNDESLERRRGSVAGRQIVGLYTVCDAREQGFPLKASVVETHYDGHMSPLSPLSLPKERKRNAGIVEQATQYAYIHPPKKLASDLDWDKVKAVWKNQVQNAQLTSCNDKRSQSREGYVYDLGIKNDLFETNSRPTMTSHLSKRKDLTLDGSSPNPFSSLKNCFKKEKSFSIRSAVLPKEWSLACFSVLGAFAYFDDDRNVLSINVLCFTKTDYSIQMTGPYETSPETVQVIKNRDRFQVIPLEHYHEWYVFSYFCIHIIPDHQQLFYIIIMINSITLISP